MEHAQTDARTMPVEVIQLIVSHLPPSKKFAARLASKSFYAAATPEAFKHIKLDAKSSKRFERIAETPKLRRYVREITFDARGSSRSLNINDDTSFRAREFFKALPFIRFYSGLKTLNLVFNRGSDIPLSSHETGSGVDYDTRYCIRHWVMIATFHCILGSRILDSNANAVDESVVSHGLMKHLTAKLGITDEAYWGFLKEERPTIHIEQLSITNLAQANTLDYGLHEVNDQGDTMDPFTEWPVFKQITSLPSLRKLNLMIAPDKKKLRESDEYTETYTFEPRSRVRFVVDCLPKWFTPAAARNLTVLSLHYDDIWGYYPKFDFRCINPGDHPEAGFPHLRVLSLSRYCFSHEWQMDWIASLGRCGLRELYLDECVLLSVAYCYINPKEADIDGFCVRDVDGNEIRVSNHGYLPDSWRGGHSQDPWVAYYQPNLRWRHFFDHWRTNMPSLVVFKMGATETHTTWSRVRMSDHWVENSPPPTAIPSGHLFMLTKADAHNKFQDLNYRRDIRMAELKVPFYVAFSPEPLDVGSQNFRPWVFLPVTEDEFSKGSQDMEDLKDDIKALGVFRETVKTQAQTRKLG
ncbi:f-box domain protein [Colletotrichum truncatum]|uniref:F-box domain protein n=1 Tax=Colletotrichum truncatum TaxID=5467 RepID=A0ACC3YRP1_COLTU|nr:f-box domain protein [Colletotrichum truncatum]XP_036577329.1 f-box domain protein [Colletotrichum truncatum]XP_036586522.1 f-box domain protein [Colletotrichum truncatum]KAF6780543.1 f-box domain protein [Colletotrichum truncatum]KAF6784269.1 f-box domain protein [Colletotrichum truncatum]KAF6796929.1 f-box domain protein [Colletotrichum truncatum]